MELEVRDVIFSKGKAFEVSGVYLSAPGGQSTVGLIPMSTVNHDEFKVPIEIAQAFIAYRPVTGRD